MKRWVAAAKADELQAGRPKILEVEGVRIGLFKLGDGTLCAVQDVCTHDDGPLAEGPVEGCEIECPRHGARFDLKTGAALCMPAIAPVRTFPVRSNGGQIEIEFE
jgi:3-phenylpropionate/trans-cinnamate dioxygenase ferredoxin subunit